MARKSPSVVLVGRPNVGKSTLFNRMTGSRRAIVAPLAGTTRDALARPVLWGGRSFELFDTGGLYGSSLDPLHALVVEQGKRAIEGADLVVMLVDGREGLVPGDQQIARELHETGTPVVLAINKTDDKRARDAGTDFYSLGFEPVIDISAEHGGGVAELLDEIVQRLDRSHPAGRHLPPPRRASRSSAVPTSESRRWSTACCGRNGSSSAICRGRRATRSTRR